MRPQRRSSHWKSVLPRLGLLLGFTALFGYFYIYVPFLSGDYADVESRKGYFSIANSFPNPFFAFLGILLGGYYYFDRQRREASQHRHSQAQARVKQLLEDFGECDGFVIDFLARSCKTQQQLDALRLRISAGFDNFIMVLDASTEIVGFADADLSEVLLAYSFVEKNRLIMRSPLGVVQRARLSHIQEHYFNLARSARRAIVGYLE